MVHVQNVCVLLDSVETVAKLMPLRSLVIRIRVAAILANISNVITSLMDFISVLVKQDGRVAAAIKLLIHAILVLVRMQEHAQLPGLTFIVLAFQNILDKSVKVS